MAKQTTQMQMPGVFGGLMRYDSEYKSRFMFSPKVVIGYVIAILVFVLLLRVFFPVNIGSISGLSWVFFNILGVLFL